MDEFHGIVLSGWPGTIQYICESTELDFLRELTEITFKFVLAFTRIGEVNFSEWIVGRLSPMV